MTTMLVEVLFWSAVFVGLYVVLKRLQTRRDARGQDAKTTPQHRSEKDDA